MTTMAALLTIILASSFSIVKSDPNTNINYLGCSTQTYPSNNLYGNNVIDALVDLTNVTPAQPGYKYYAQSPNPAPVVYGHATCAQALANSDCARCLSSARDAVFAVCSGHVGGQVEMVDCSMRYENYPSP